MDDKKLRRLAKRAVVAYERYKQADGIFPDPEYDAMDDALHDLGVALGMDMAKLAEKWRDHYEAVPRITDAQ